MAGCGPDFVRIQLELKPESDGGFVVTCPLLPELVTEGDTMWEALQNAKDAYYAVREIYEDSNRDLPAELFPNRAPEVLSCEAMFEAVPA